MAPPAWLRTRLLDKLRVLRRSVVRNVKEPLCSARWPLAQARTFLSLWQSLQVQVRWIDHYWQPVWSRAVAQPVLLLRHTQKSELLRLLQSVVQSQVHLAQSLVKLSLEWACSSSLVKGLSWPSCHALGSVTQLVYAASDTVS